MEMNRKRWLDIGLVTLVLLLCTVTIVLTLENRSLKNTINDLTSPLQPTNDIVGRDATPIRILNLNNQIDEIIFTNTKIPILLFVFNTSCPHCEHTLLIWNSVVNNLDSGVCNVAGLSLDDVEKTRSYMLQKNIAFNVASIHDSTFSSNYGIGGIPQTILVSQQGKVKQIWSGKLQISHISNILDAINDSTIYEYHTDMVKE